MNLLTSILRIIGSGATAYIMARSLRDWKTRPNLLAGFQLAESGAVPFLEALSQRAAAEGDHWLAERLARHAQDERRHGAMFAQALKQLDKQVIDFKARAERSEQSSDRDRSPFFEAYFQGYTQAQLKPDAIEWPVFFASTYILELDASKDFRRMAQALSTSDASSVNLQKSLVSIANDEGGHAAYLHEAMVRSLPADQVSALIDEWATRKVDALMAAVGGFLQRQGQMRSLVQDGAPSELSDSSADLTSATAA